MSSITRGEALARAGAVTASAMLLVALAGCAGNPGSNGTELHQDRASKQSAAAGASAELQGERLAAQAAAQVQAPAAASGTNAAEAQGMRLAEYAESLAGSGSGSGSGGASWAEHRGIEE